MSDDIAVPHEESEVTPNYEEIAMNLNEQLKQYKFLSDTIQFNATIYQGLTILLEKVTSIEEKLNGNTK